MEAYKVPIFPSRKIDVTSDDEKKYRFLMYTKNDYDCFIESLNQVDESIFFNDIDLYLKGKQKIFRLREQEFEYKDFGFVDMGYAFVITDDSSTWNKDYNG
jgi:hypothetical protein